MVIRLEAGAWLYDCRLGRGYKTRLGRGYKTAGCGVVVRLQAGVWL